MLVAVLFVSEVSFPVEVTEAGGADKNDENISSPEPLTFAWLVVGASVNNNVIKNYSVFYEFHVLNKKLTKT